MFRAGHSSSTCLNPASKTETIYAEIYEDESLILPE